MRKKARSSAGRVGAKRRIEAKRVVSRAAHLVSIRYATQPALAPSRFGYAPTERISQLRAEWFRRLEALGRAMTGASGLECASLCTGRCCPHAAMATREPAYTVSHVVIMLPFEMEYIVARTGVHPARFRRTPAKIAPGVVVEIGSFDIEMPCPFLTDDFQCWGYAFRPMDCRSFPLVPVFGDGGELTFRLGTGCPSLDTFSPAYQARLKAAWRNLLPHLSADYRAVYNRL